MIRHANLPVALMLMLATPSFAWSSDPAQAAQETRQMYCAGSWYPKDPAALSKMIDDLLTSAHPPEVAGKPIAVIAPHAGYRFSAPVAAAAYRLIKDRDYERVIVLAFSHANAGRYGGIDVPSSLTAYQTPLGSVPIDRAACDRLLKHPPFAAHDGIDQGEHSLELQLPFLQRTVKSFKLVPLLVGRMSDEDYGRAAEALLPLVDDKTLLVASSDFTHYGPRYGFTPFDHDVPAKLEELADDAAKAVERCDFDAFMEHVRGSRDTICGRGPIALLLRVLSSEGDAKGVRAAYDTSGNITGDFSNSVTYQSFVFVRDKGGLDRGTKAALLSLARRTVEAYLNGKALPTPAADSLSSAARADGACFVTLENHGRLRGCIGNMVATGPLYESVIHNAVSACQDHRFVSNPVTAPELGQLEIEISYLTPMKPVENTDDIVVGRHGLMITLGRWRGVLLPQVASRLGWTRDEFLAQVCRKAGLPMDAWKRPDARLYSFEADVFNEAELAGNDRSATEAP